MNPEPEDTPVPPLPDHDYDCWAESQPVRDDEKLEVPLRFETRVTVPESILDEVLSNLEAHIGNTTDLLTSHDAALGRTTRKNQWIAEHYEEDIAIAAHLRDRIKAILHR